jgi:hypothetical protein
MHSISDIEDRIAQLQADILPLQEYYGIKSRSIEERYRDIQARKQAEQSIPKPRFKLPKL